MSVIVPPIGPRDKPKIAIVGEAPGRDEEREGRPFVGASGRLLDQMLAAAGIARGECYITNVSKVRPPGNNFAAMFYDGGNKRFPTHALLDARKELWQELRTVQPSVVVPMGAEAMAALGIDGSISDRRGMMNFHHNLRVLPTYHPAYLLRGMYELRPVVEADLKKALRQALFPSRPYININPNPSFEDVMELLYKRPEYIAVDIETVETMHTRMIGIAWSKFEAMAIPLMRGYEHAWTAEQEAEILLGLQRLFLDPHTKKFLQNMMFDRTILARELGLELRSVILDTMLGHHLLFPELPKGLDFLCSIYTDHEHYWSYDKSSLNSTATYCCMDCIVTFESALEIKDQLTERKQWDFYRGTVHRAAENLMRIQSRGVLIDQKAREEIKESTLGEMEDIRQRISRVVGHELNPSSPKQVANLCYEEWKLPKQIHPKTKKPTTDDDALKILAKRHPVREMVLKDIIDFRQKRVLVGNFCEQLLKDGRAMTSFNPAGTVTGRLASSATIEGYGGNLQNIPRGKFRRIFIADPGKVLIKADLSQAEYRVLIWKARIYRVIDRWTTEPGFNIHMWNASENIYKIPIEKVTKVQYQNAKNGVYGANYGIGPIKVSRMYIIELPEARFIINSYHQAVPEVKAVYQREIEQEINETRKIVNALGRERVFFGRLDEETYRAAYSHYCQSTVADLILDGLNELEESGVEVLLQIHDELVVQCDDNPTSIRETAAKVKKAMERPLFIKGVDTPLVIPVEMKIGKDWFNTVGVEEYLSKS